MAERKYRINKFRWDAAKLSRFEVTDNGVKSILSDDGTYKGPSVAYLKPVDSGIEDSSWGRLSFKCIHGSDAAGYTYVYASDDEYIDLGLERVVIWDVLSDPDKDDYYKLKLLTDQGARKFVNSDDILLYDFKGRYLFLAFEAVGNSVVEIKDMCVYSIGDAFMNTFPEVYRERGSFFHRWMSVYSTIYTELQEEIDDLPKLLDLDTCPAELLPVYASWLGFDISLDILPEDVCRNLVKEGFELCRKKGTRWAITRIIEIVLGCNADVLEHNTMRGYLLSDGAELPPNLKEGGVYDVTILIHGEISELTRHRLLFLLDQFKPVRARLHLVELERNAKVDGNAYLDMNAAIPVGEAPTLDGDSSMGGILTLT